MPDRYGDEPIDLNGPDDVWAAGQRRKYAIVNCDLCDDDGYAGLRVCDHVDHTAAAARGMEKVRAVLDKKRHVTKPLTQAQTPEGAV